jgi:hypothetical protein
VVDAYFTNGGIYEKWLRVAQIPLVTADGPLAVPVKDVRRIDFAARAEGASDVVHLDGGKTVTGRIEGEAFGLGEYHDPVRLDQLTHVIPRPPGMDDYAGQFGTQHQFTITGRTGGTLFGSNPYTLHSCLGTAAVHAGVLKEGEMGVVQVEIIVSPKSFEGSKKNKLKSDTWNGDYDGGAFRILEPHDKSKAARPQSRRAKKKPTGGDDSATS